MYTKGKMSGIKNRLISFEELKNILSNVNKTKEEKREAFCLYIGDRRKEGKCQ